MKRRLLLAAVGIVAVTALATGSLASARQNAVTGKLTVTGSNGDYVLTIENASTSTGNIRCWRWMLGQGAMVTAASRVDGWRLGLSKPAPAPIIAGQIVPPGDGIPPGGKQTFRILTDKPFDGAGSPGTAAISEDCRTDAAAEIVFGSPPKPIPTPPPSACNCTNLTVVGTKYSSSQVNSGKAQLKLSLNWTLSCSGAAGRPCSGRFEILAPAGSDIRLDAPANGKVSCKGRCIGPPSTARGTAKLRATSAGDLYFDERAGKSFAFRLRLYCTRNGREALVGAKRLTFSFNRAGFLDRRKSDLNGDGVPDGKDG